MESEDVTMRSLELLIEEHRVLWRALSLLEKAALKSLRGESLDPKVFKLLLKFFSEFDFCHQMKEEKALFPRLLESSRPPRGFIEELISEHALSRRALKVMIEMLEEGLESMDSDFRRSFIGNTLGYVRALRAHISKENDRLFKIAGEVLIDEDNRRLLEEFRGVEVSTLGPGARERLEQLTRLLDEVEILLGRG